MTIVGEIRPSQLLFTYGIGALINLPRFSAVVQGIDHWRLEYAPSLEEERLLMAVQSRLGSQVQRLVRPPVDPKGKASGFGKFKGNTGLPLAPFPRYMVCQSCQRLAPMDGTLFAFHEDNFSATEHAFVHTNCHKRSNPRLIPSRFFVVCDNGHMDDFPWHYYVHRGPSDCPGDLRLISFGSELSATQVQCKIEDCKASRSLADAFSQRELSMPACQGVHIHLKDGVHRDCNAQMKPMTLGASNAWFAQSLSVLSIPSVQDTELDERIDTHWENLRQIEEQSEIKTLKKFRMIPELIDYSDEIIFEAVKNRQNQSSEEADQEITQESLFAPEYEILTHPESVVPGPDFELEAEPVPEGWKDILSQVVLVRRLREVRALTGFSRINAPEQFEGGEAGQIAPISLGKPIAVPASEVRGEGIFLNFNLDKLQAWALSEREQLESWLDAHYNWRLLRRYSEPNAEFPGLQYVFLHSLSHALMRQLSLECGYSAASIRERIYSTPEGTPKAEAMAGILIYTASPDAEGTLGGLVELGNHETLGYMLNQALSNAQLCSSDPLCAEHELNASSQIDLHAAACHACLFAPETSCERGNRYLDRSLLTPTLSHQNRSFLNPMFLEDFH